MLIMKNKVYVINRFYIDGYSHMIFNTVVYVGDDLAKAREVYKKLSKYAQKNEGYELTTMELNDTYIADTILQEYKKYRKKRKKKEQPKQETTRGINYGQELLEFLKGRLKNAKIGRIGKGI